MAKNSFLKLTIAEFFTPDGRIGRMTYFAYGWGLRIAFFAIMISIALIFDSFSIPDGSPLLSAVLIVLLLLYGYLFFCISGKRLHDIGLPATVGVFLLLGDAVYIVDLLLVNILSIKTVISPNLFLQIESILNLVTLIGSLLLLFIKGENQDNKYGTNLLAYYKPKPHILD